MSDDPIRNQGYDLYLSYSGRKTYLTCPKKYEFNYIVKPSVEIDVRNTLFGSIIGKIFEWFYERKLWATEDPISALSELYESAIECVLAKEKFEEYMDPGLMSIIRSDLRIYVPSGVEIIRKYGFLTPYSTAEENLNVIYGNQKYSQTLKIGGRCDFKHATNLENVWILDGKSSAHREKYVDSEQLIWYAVQHYIKYRVAPSRLGFIYWRFPEDPVTWIKFDDDSLRNCMVKTFEVAEKISLKQFQATPSGECHRCQYKSICDDGHKYLAGRKAEGGKLVDTLFELEQI